MFETELRTALSWLDATDALALRYEGSSPEMKADGTPVTVGDRAVETHLRASLATAFPGDAILGEEEGGAGGERCWIIDPIDGTKNYLARIPVYATLIALEVAGVVEVAVVSAPALRVRWWAVRGGGAFRDGVPIRVSAVSELADARLCHGGLDWDPLGTSALAAATTRARGFGDFWGYCLVAEGAMDLMYEPASLARWDLAAPRLLVEEAGGRVTDPRGGDDPRDGAVLASNALVHEAALKVLASAG